MRRNSFILAACLLVAVALPGNLVWAQGQTNFGGTATYGPWVQQGYRPATAQTAGLDIVVASNDSTRLRVVSRTGVLRVDRNPGEIKGAFEILMLQRFVPLGRDVDIYGQAGVGGLDVVVLDADDEAYVFGVFEIGINLWGAASLGVGSYVVFQDEGNQYNLYSKLDLMRIPL